MVRHLRVTSICILILLLLSSWIYVLPVHAVNYSVTIVMDSSDDAAGARIRIDGVNYRNNDVVSLSAGTHTCEAVTPSGWGWLSWFQTANTPVTNPSSSSTTFTVNGNGVLGADWGPVVTFYASPSNGGTITVHYYGAASPFDEIYSNGQSGVIKGVSSSLVANAGSGYTFSSWSSTGPMSISSSTSANTQWNPSGPGTVTCTFQPVTPAYSVTIVMDSSDDAAGCRISIDGVSHRNNDVVSLSAGSHSCVAVTPANWGWLGWFTTTNCQVANPSSSSTTLTVSGNGAFGADWGPIVTFYTSPDSGGTVSVYYYGAATPFTETYSNGQSGVIKGSSSELVANPASGYTFLSWSSTGSVSVNSPTSSPTYWSPAGPGTVTCNFQGLSQVTFNTNPTSGGVSLTFSGTGYANGQSGNYASADYSASANAPTGYAFHHWEYSGSSGSGVYVPNINVNPATVQVRGNGWLKAVFSAQVAFATNPSSAGSIQYGSNSYTNGQSVWEVNLPPEFGNIINIVANVPSGYTFSGWSVSGGLSVYSASSSSTSLTVTGPGTLTANFQAPNPQITFNTNPTTGGVSLTFSGTPYTNGQIGSYASGDYSATANAPSGYAFHHWEYSGSSGNGVYVPNININPTTVQVRGNGWLKAVFSAQITFSTNPSSVGSIQYSGTSFTNGQTRWEPNLPPDYSNSVHIVAVVPSGYTFNGWSTAGGLSVSSPSSSDTTLTVTGPGALTANFQAQPVNYDVTIVLESADDAAGCRIQIDGVNHRNNDVVSLSAGSHSCVAVTPANWGWISWFETTNCHVANPSSSSTTLTVSGNGVLGADWGPIVTFYTSPINGGTITVNYWGASPPFTETYSNGQSGVMKGPSSNLIANSASGYTFSSWSSTGSVSIGSPSSSTSSWNPTGPGTVTADFQPIVTTYGVNFKTNPTSGSLSITFSGTSYAHGQSGNYASGDYSATANAPSGYQFHHWEYSGSSGNGVYVPNININPTTVQVRGDGWLKAVFSAQITFSTNPSDKGSIAYGGTTYTNAQTRWEPNLPPDYSNTVPIVANVPSGYTFGGWSTTGGLSVSTASSSSTSLTVNGPGTLTANFNAPPTVFSVSVSPSSRSVVRGGTVDYTVTVSWSSGSGTVSLSLSGLPLSVGVESFSPSSSSASSWTSTLTIGTFQAASPASYSLTVTGTSGGTSNSASCTLVVQLPPDDYLVSSSPTSRSVTAGGASTSYTITATLQSGSPSGVSLSLDSPPGWLSWGFSPSSGSPTFSSTLTVSASSSAPSGSHTLYVKGSGGGMPDHIIAVTLTVNAPPTVQYTLNVVSGHGSPTPSLGSHSYNSGSSVTCSVSSPVTEGSTVWTCAGWTGSGSVPSSGSGTSTTFTITQDSVITWNWVPQTIQRSLTVVSAHGSPNPPVGQWLYDSGTSVTCSVSSPVTEGGTTWVCTGWTGYGSVQSSGSGTTTTFTITQESGITWIWQIQPTQQRLLTVSSAHGSPNPSVGSHSYASGSQVVCSVSSPVTEGGTVWICTGWSGSGSVQSSGSGTSTTFTITQDSSITWNWQPQPTPLPLTPSLISPSNGATLSSATVAFSWSSSSGAADYQLEVNGPSSKLETVYSTSYTATLSLGSYTWRVRAHNSYGWSDWASTWGFTVNAPPPPQLGSLVVTVKNFNGVAAATMPGTTTVKLYTYSGNIVSSVDVNSNSQASWSGLNAGTYSIAVSHSSGLGISVTEFWGTDSFTVSSGSNSRSFTRHAPIFLDIQYSTSSPTVGQTVTVSVSVKDLESSAIGCSVRLVMDGDKVSSYDYDQTSGSVSVSAGGTYTFTFSFTPSAAGTYYPDATLNSVYGSTFVTDSWPWDNAKQLSARALPISAIVESIQRPNAAYKEGEYVEAQITIKNTGQTAASYLAEFSIIGPPSTLVSYETSGVAFSYENSVPGGTSTVTQFIGAGKTGIALMKWKVPSDAPAGSYSLDVRLYSYDFILQKKGSLLNTRSELFLFSVDQGYSYAESYKFAFGATGVHVHISKDDMDSPVFFGLSTRSYLWISRGLEAAEVVVGLFTPDLQSEWLKAVGDAVDANDAFLTATDIGSAILFGDDGADFLLLQFLTLPCGFFSGHDFVWLKNIFHWPDPGIAILYDFNSIPVPGYWLLNLPDTGSVTQLSEPGGQHKLYLHVYDTSGRHVGFDAATNRTQTQIPGSYYTDIDNKITIFIPSNITDIKYVVDSNFAESQTEEYTIKVIKLNGTQIISSFDKSETIASGEKKEKILYYLSVASLYGTPTGDGWYENGSIANFSVSPTEFSTGFLTYKALGGWSGDVQTKDPRGTIVVDSPKSVVAEWTDNYTPLYTLIAVVIVMMVSIVAFLVLKRKSKYSARQHDFPGHHKHEVKMLLFFEKLNFYALNLIERFISKVINCMIA